MKKIILLFCTVVLLSVNRFAVKDSYAFDPETLLQSSVTAFETGDPEVDFSEEAENTNSSIPKATNTIMGKISISDIYQNNDSLCVRYTVTPGNYYLEYVLIRMWKGSQPLDLEFFRYQSNYRVVDSSYEGQFTKQTCISLPPSYAGVLDFEAWTVNWYDNYNSYISNKSTKSFEYKVIFPTGITLDQTEIYVPINRSKEINATFSGPSDMTHKRITWTSEDENIAYVNNGFIHGVSEGTTIISAETQNGLKAQCTVHVYDSRITIVDQPVTTFVDPNKIAHFNIYAESTVPGAKPVYQWQKKVNDTWQNVGTAETTNFTIILDGTAENHEQVYRCKVTDEDGNIAYSKEVMVVVKGLPLTKNILIIPEDPLIYGEIGEKAFYGINAEIVYIPYNITTIGSQAFGNCQNLKEIYFESDPFNLAEDFLSGSNKNLEIYAGQSTRVYKNKEIYKQYLAQ